MSTFYTLPAVGAEVTVCTHLVIRDDAHILYAFGTERERRLFRELLKVSNVGPKIALALLSGISVDGFLQCVEAEDADALVRVPGVGRKTAERLLLELKGRLAPELPGAAGTVASDAGGDIIRALISLGYSDREAAGAVRALPAGVSVSDGIRQALKQLGKS